MKSLLTSMLNYIRRQGLLKPGDRVGVAVSGGADSVALLCLLLQAHSELGVSLAVVHFNHRIRAADADADQAFVAELAEREALAFYCVSGETVAHAQNARVSLEAAARELRYQYFRSLLAGGKLNRIATAHTLDDQAETVLLRLLRGAGTRGLAGIYPEVVLEHAYAALETERPVGRPHGFSHSTPGSSGKLAIVRPLLSARRQQLREYLASIGQSWREDASNLDLKHTRNRVRQELIPFLERGYNPALQPVLSELAELAREEERFWAAETARVLPQVLVDPPSPRTLDMHIPALQLEPLALRRRLIRAAVERLGLQLEFCHVEQVLALIDTSGGETRRLELPGGLHALASQGKLRFEFDGEKANSSYEYELPIPGVVEVPALGMVIRAVLNGPEAYNQQHSLDPELLGSSLRVRNWRPGDRYRPAHTKSARKLKELLQERRIPQPEKALWPVVVAGEKIVWVPGWDFPQELQLQREGPGVVLRQEPLPPKDPSEA